VPQPEPFTSYPPGFRVAFVSKAQLAELERDPDFLTAGQVLDWRLLPNERGYRGNVRYVLKDDATA
jgi:hypothetical protein